MARPSGAGSAESAADASGDGEKAFREIPAAQTAAAEDFRKSRRDFPGISSGHDKPPYLGWLAKIFLRSSLASQISVDFRVSSQVTS